MWVFLKITQGYDFGIIENLSNSKLNKTLSFVKLCYYQGNFKDMIFKLKHVNSKQHFQKRTI